MIGATITAPLYRCCDHAAKYIAASGVHPTAAALCANSRRPLHLNIIVAAVAYLTGINQSAHSGD